MKEYENDIVSYVNVRQKKYFANLSWAFSFLNLTQMKSEYLFLTLMSNLLQKVYRCSFKHGGKNASQHIYGLWSKVDVQIQPK